MNGLLSRTTRMTMLLLLQLLLLPTAAATTIVQTLTGPLPQTLSSLVHSEEDAVATSVCWLASAGVSRHAQQQVLQTVVGGDSAVVSESSSVVVVRADDSSSSTIALVIPSWSPSTVVSSILKAADTAASCSDVAYYMSDLEDISNLLPALQQIVGQTQPAPPPRLWIVTETPLTADQQQRLQTILSDQVSTSLVGNNNNNNIVHLSEITASVEFVTASSLVAAVAASSKQNNNNNNGAADFLSSTTTTSAKTTTTTTFASSSPKEAAAARRLGPLSRKLLAEALARIRQECFVVTSEDDDDLELVSREPVLVPELGALWRASVERLQSEFKQAGPPGLLWQTTTGQTIRQQVTHELNTVMESTVLSSQLDLQYDLALDALKQAWSKLLISPFLQRDMQQAADTVVSNFGTAIQKLVPTSSSMSTTATALLQARQTELRRYIRGQIQQRLTSAQASGKFKGPVPRKGVVVGFHWLLPKPFGNDYRQEPWTVHAADNLVYVPQDTKVVDVDPSTITTSDDWKSKIVPSPIGNDLIYMQ